VREQLCGIFGAERVITEPERLREYRDDYSEVPAQEPAAVVFPLVAEEIAALVRLAATLGASVTPRVANTNVAGIAIAAPGGIVADLSRMNRIVDVDADEMVAVIEPGVSQAQLKQYLLDHELPLTLGYSLGPPHVSILANCVLDGLTNRSLKYGSMAQWISGLEVVLGDGTVLRTGSWSIRGLKPFARAPMPDLSGLFTGFQGTTGIVTQLALQLWPRHPIEKRLFVLGYDAEGVYAAMQRLCRLEICEDIGGLGWPAGKMMLGVKHPSPRPDPDEPTFFLYVDLAAELDEELRLKERLLGRVLDAERARGKRFEEPIDVRTLLQLNPAMGAFAEFPTDLEFLTNHGGGGLTWMGTYGPLSRFAPTADACSAIMVEHGFPPTIVSRAMRGGHFGVLRFVLTFDKSAPDEVERVRHVMRLLLAAVTDAGFGMYKTPGWALEWLRDRIDPRALELIRSLKRLTDPHGVLNPGKWAI
jgi:glycolate oxidase